MHVSDGVEYCKFRSKELAGVGYAPLERHGLSMRCSSGSSYKNRTGEQKARIDRVPQKGYCLQVTTVGIVISLTLPDTEDAVP